MQYITRRCTFDSGHRVMNERMKCFNIHGHTYHCELTFAFKQMEDIGYAIDFKEIKRVGCQWVDDILDHGMLLNPQDTELIQTTKNYGSKYWLMSLNGKDQYCNPTVENIAKEIFLAQDRLFAHYPTLNIHHVRLFETPNCWTDCYNKSISKEERINFDMVKANEIDEYAKDKGIIEYDDRKVT